MNGMRIMTIKRVNQLKQRKIKHQRLIWKKQNQNKGQIQIIEKKIKHQNQINKFEIKRKKRKENVIKLK